MAITTHGAGGEFVALNELHQEKLTVSSAAVALAEIPATGTVLQLMIRISGADVRFRGDGTAPTSAIGFILKDGDTLLYNNIAKGTDAGSTNAERFGSLEFIRTAATDAEVDVIYLGIG